MTNQDQNAVDQNAAKPAEGPSKVELALQALADSNASLAQKLSDWQAKQAEAAVPPKKAWKDRFYDEDPESLVNDIKEEAKREVLSLVNEANSREAQKNVVLGQLLNEYPELASDADPLKKRSVELHKTLPAHLQGTAEGFRIAVRDAAAEMGVLPKAKRKEATQVNDDNNDDDDSFVVAGSKGAPPSRRKAKSGELADATLAFAELLGRPVDDPKYMERLKKANERTVWSKYKKAK